MYSLYDILLCFWYCTCTVFLLFLCISFTFENIIGCSYFLFLLQLLVTHRVVILQTIELVVGSRIENISYPRIKSVITLASDEMTRSKVY